MAKVSKLFKILNIWGIGGIDKRTGGETPFQTSECCFKTLSAIISFDYLKSGVWIDFLVWIQDPSPRPKVIVVVELAATAYK